MLYDSLTLFIYLFGWVNKKVWFSYLFTATTTWNVEGWNCIFAKKEWFLSYSLFISIVPYICQTYLQANWCSKFYLGDGAGK